MTRAEFIRAYTDACLAKWKAEGARPSELVMSQIELERDTAPRMWRRHREALRTFTADQVREHVGKAAPRDYKASPRGQGLSPDLIRRIVDASCEAQAAFWKVVGENFPEATTGDFDPVAFLRFDVACQSAVTHWVDCNFPKPHNPACKCGECKRVAP